MRLKENLTNDSIPNSELLSEGRAAVRYQRFFSDRNSELSIKYWSDPLCSWHRSAVQAICLPQGA
jgi:hypothetical protein